MSPINLLASAIAKVLSFSHRGGYFRRPQLVRLVVPYEIGPTSLCEVELELSGWGQLTIALPEGARLRQRFTGTTRFRFAVPVQSMLPVTIGNAWGVHRYILDTHTQRSETWTEHTDLHSEILPVQALRPVSARAVEVRISGVFSPEFVQELPCRPRLAEVFDLDVPSFKGTTFPFLAEVTVPSVTAVPINSKPNLPFNSIFPSTDKLNCMLSRASIPSAPIKHEGVSRGVQ